MADHNSDDPFAPRDGTVLRPRPGAGRRSGSETTFGSTFATPSPRTVLPGTTTSFSGSSSNLADFLVGARNPIIQAAAPLLTLGARLATAVQHANIATLRQQAVRKFVLSRSECVQRALSPEDAVVARYVLCTFVDSAVLNTPWGAQGDWAGQSLLVIFHKEVSGGEKVFDILERLRSNPTRYVDLMELVYVCLALGYEGKYRARSARPGAARGITTRRVPAHPRAAADS